MSGGPGWRPWRWSWEPGTHDQGPPSAPRVTSTLTQTFSEPEHWGSLRLPMARLPGALSEDTKESLQLSDSGHLFLQQVMQDL